MAIADTSTSALRFVEEVTPGTTPASPTLKELRRTGDDLTETLSTTNSATITSERAIADAIPTTSDVAGTINYEFAADEYDVFLESGLQNQFTAVVDVTASTLSFDSTDDSINDSGAGFPTGDLDVGQILFVSGATNPENNGQFYIASVSASKIVFASKREATLGVVDEIAGANVRYQASTLRNGSTRKYFTFEKEFATTGTYNFLQFTGCEVGDMEINWEVESILTGGFTMLGLGAGQTGSTVGSANTPANANPIMNAMNNVGEIRENDTILGNVQSLTVSIANNLQAVSRLGAFEKAAVINGTFEPTGTIAVYFEGQDVAIRARNLEYTSIDLDVTDSDGVTYVFTMPRVRLNSVPIPTGANNEPVIMNIEYSAVRDANGVAFQIDKKPA